MTGSAASASSPRRPVEDADYRRGYLCGAVHGDDHLFRLTPAGREALERVDLYLAELGLADERRGGRGLPRGARGAAGGGVAAARADVAVGAPTAQWCKGFLAGVFDADGSSGEAVRIANSDPAVLRRAADSLRVLGFHFVSEDAASLRLLGGSAEHLRFFHTVDPAIRRKCTIAGRAVKFPGCCASRRSSRSGSTSRCTTSRPARATSSPTAS